MLDRFEAFVTGITACYKYIQKIKSAQMTELGLKGTHVMCLFYLHHSPQGLTSAQLCRLCAEDKAAISRTLGELERQEYLNIRQLEGKRYRARIFLTPSGVEIAQQMEGMMESWVGIGGEGLDEEERAAFYRTLRKIALNLRDNFE